MKMYIVYDVNGKAVLEIDGQGDTLIVQDSLDLTALIGVKARNLNVQIAGNYGTCGTSGSYGDFSTMGTVNGPSVIRTTADKYPNNAAHDGRSVGTVKGSLGTSSGNGPLDGTAGTDGNQST